MDLISDPISYNSSLSICVRSAAWAEQALKVYFYKKIDSLNSPYLLFCCLPLEFATVVAVKFIFLCHCLFACYLLFGCLLLFLEHTDFFLFVRNFTVYLFTMRKHAQKCQLIRTINTSIDTLTSTFEYCNSFIFNFFLSASNRFHNYNNFHTLFLLRTVSSSVLLLLLPMLLLSSSSYSTITLSYNRDSV